MKDEINGDFYCSGFCTNVCGHFPSCPDNCRQRHRKYPTPEQYKKEYGEKWPFSGAVYCQHDSTNWYISYLENVIDAYKVGNCLVVCACTPFGKPNNDWRP